MNDETETKAKLQNRSLDRGIDVLEALARHGACSLADLNRHTGLAKSTLRRLIGTLLERHIIRQSLTDKLYRSNVIFPPGSDAPQALELTMLVDRAMPHLVALTRKVGWPSDIHIVEGSKMRIVDSTRPLSPYRLNHGFVNRVINIFGSASGSACLAAMPDAIVAEHAKQTAGDPVWGLRRFDMSLDTYLERLETVRTQGFGLRLSNYLGETVLDDGLAAMAVPIFVNDWPSGAVTLVWPRTFKSPEEFSESFLPDLKKAAQTISNAIAGKQSAA
ncbi:helix-turn-helix domain-containing protein [Roseibium sp. CAU 1637]|uniref:Helix-turn-helix domain-containing protein n=1 Tax=Roseibium limicola TaxID=2816037 RepID=A0A939J6Q5_9HYPH|nr:helix-turn-helix domain-containing protein [Roseibium limicola]MBO0345367.1 helix-turn-helix domain-containing protein [Roseibium limicola]